MTIREALSDDDIAGCYPVMAELRPHIREEDFVSRVRRQQESGFRLSFLEEDGEVRAVAGFRILLNLAWGRFLYVDDLVSGSRWRSQGCGGQLLDWLADLARAQDCDELHLDSGVQRFGAHRFYLCKRMDITCHHFALKVKALRAPCK